MIRFFLSCMASLCLAACSSWPAASRDGVASPTATAPIGHYHFAWKLSGNRAVAPLQVFDNGRQTWLQFPPGQPIPAIFARLPQGDQLLAPTTGGGGLIMLDGVWPQLMVRGGALQSVAQRLPADAPTVALPAVPAPPAAPVSSVSPLASATSVLPTASATVVSIPVDSNVSLSSAATVTPHADASPLPAMTIFQVSPADGTLRAALARWAKTTGWTFAFEHWAVEVDIPIVAAAAFPLPFEEAVQALVASTELSDQPLRPCFYTNQVLRIVTHTQPCDRSAVGRG